MNINHAAALLRLQHGQKLPVTVPTVFIFFTFVTFANGIMVTLTHRPQTQTGKKEMRKNPPACIHCIHAYIHTSLPTHTYILYTELSRKEYIIYISPVATKLWSFAFSCSFHLHLRSKVYLFTASACEHCTNAARAEHGLMSHCALDGVKSMSRTLAAFSIFHVEEFSLQGAHVDCGSHGNGVSTHNCY